MKPILLFWTLLRKPGEFYERVGMILESRWGEWGGQRPFYLVHEEQQALQALSCALGTSLPGALQESALADIESRVRDGTGKLPADAPFGTFHNGDTLFGRFCYALARAQRPRTIVETGVCYGVTSSFLLQALDVNGEGCLHSIDLPPLGEDADGYVGRLIPQELRSRWRLHRGTTKRLLPPLLTELRPIDLFVHDSLHTHRNMRMEFEAAWPALRRGGVLISDDVEGNKAFLELTRRSDVACSVVVKEREKDSLLGVAVKRG